MLSPARVHAAPLVTETSCHPHLACPWGRRVLQACYGLEPLRCCRSPQPRAEVAGDELTTGGWFVQHGVFVLLDLCGVGLL